MYKLMAGQDRTTRRQRNRVTIMEADLRTLHPAKSPPEGEQARRDAVYDVLAQHGPLPQSSIAKHSAIPLADVQAILRGDNRLKQHPRNSKWQIKPGK